MFTAYHVLAFLQEDGRVVVDPEIITAKSPEDARDSVVRRLPADVTGGYSIVVNPLPVR